MREKLQRAKPPDAVAPVSTSPFPTGGRSLGCAVSNDMAAKKPMPIDVALRKAILKSGMTVYAIAKECGFQPAPLYRFLTGERDIRLETAEKIAELLDLELVPQGRNGPQ